MYFRFLQLSIFDHVPCRYAWKNKSLLRIVKRLNSNGDHGYSWNIVHIKIAKTRKNFGLDNVPFQKLYS